MNHKEGFNDSDKRIKLVLSGGGTRGVYQIGALKALEESGFLHGVVSTSGCSIGSINTALIHQYSLEECRDLWMDISAREVFKGINQYASNYFFKIAQESFFSDGLDINPFIRIFEELIDEDKVRDSGDELVFSLYNITKRRQEYASLEDIAPGRLIDYLIASSRLPFFKPLYIAGDKYLDGGVGDNNPFISRLENKHFDLVINIKIMYIPYYIPGIRKENISYDRLMTIMPSGRIGNPIEFKSPSFSEKYEMGYKDARNAIASFLNRPT